MPISGYVDKVFTETGFSNWQKALQKFDKHQQSQSHKFAANMVMRDGRQYAILVDERQIICHQHYKGRRCQLVMDKVL